MCLDSVTETYDKPSDVIIDGRKTFGSALYSASKKLEFETMAYKGSRVVPFDQWLVAEGNEIPVASSTGIGARNRYKAGFHVYQEGAKPGTLRRVYVRKVHTKGKQSGKIVLVASEMYVPSDPDGWPPKDDEPQKKRSLKDRIIGKGGNA